MYHELCFVNSTAGLVYMYKQAMNLVTLVPAEVVAPVLGHQQVQSWLKC